MNFMILSAADRLYDWNKSTTMIGHSVSTLKLNILFANIFVGTSGASAAGDIGRGDAADRG